MLQRSWYTLRQAFRYRPELQAIFRSSIWQAPRIVDINLDILQKQGIKVIVLDFDGVLAPHGAKQPLPEVKPWLDNCVASFGVDNIYILSNKPLLVREQYFRQMYPGIHWIDGVRKKPYPDGMQKIIELSKVEPTQIALVDDRLLTGILATVIAGTRCVYISQAYRQFTHNLVHESFFAMLRWLEKLWIA
ncbi:MAG: family hydrolase [Gammaproteobacteria bacterium]|nr:family hydrolase [Gammaproteobacteria bacterium]